MLVFHHYINHNNSDLKEHEVDCVDDIKEWLFLIFVDSVKSFPHHVSSSGVAWY